VVQLQTRGPHVARGNIQEKFPNLKLVEKRVRLHLSHCIACAGYSEFLQKQYLFRVPICLFIYFTIKLKGAVLRWGTCLDDLSTAK